MLAPRRPHPPIDSVRAEDRASAVAPRSPTLVQMPGGCRRHAIALLAALAIPAASTSLTTAASAAPTSTSAAPTSTAVTSAAPTSTSGVTTTTQAGVPGLPASAEPAAWIVVDADTGRVLEGKDVHTAYRPASIVKITTALAALQRLPPTAKLTVSQNAVDHGVSNQNPSGMRAGQTWSVADAVAVMMVISANDAAYAVAEATSGTLDNFARDETSTAHALGMRDSTFNDPAGLDDNTSFRGGPTMSPFDVAISVRDALHVPQMAGPANTAVYDFTDPGGIAHHVTNHNLLLNGLQYAYPDANGFKTGSTHLAGLTIAASATRNGRTIIAVLMNCVDRYNWVKAVLDRGFAAPASSKGTGEKLPAVQDLTYAHRAAVKAEAIKFLTGTRGLGTGTTTPGATATSYHTTTSTTPPRRAAAARTKTKSTSGSGGISAITWVLIVFGVLAVTLVMLRRRAVRRRRARRGARRRAQASLRRGSLPVVDGRYRPGIRTGPPPQSNVRVHRDDD